MSFASSTRFVRCIFRYGAFLLLTFFCRTVDLSAQLGPMSISPSATVPGEGYTVTLQGGNNMTIDVEYKYNGVVQDPVFAWQTLDSNGQKFVALSTSTALGTYEIYGVRQNGTSAWTPVAASVDVRQQPSTASFAPNPANQGEGYQVYTDVGFGTTVDLRRTFNGGQQIISTTILWGYGSCCGSDPQGTYTYTGIKNSVALNFFPAGPLDVIVIPPRDFTLTSNPSSQTVQQGQSATYTINVTPLNGFFTTVSLSASGLPTGATATFNPSSLDFSSGSPQTSTLTITTASTTPVGSSTITVTGTPFAGQTHSITVTLGVGTAPAVVKDYIYLGGRLVAIDTTSVTSPSPPTTPTNLTGTAISATQISLSWTASTGGSGSLGYSVYRNGSLVNATPITATSLTDSGLNPITAYSYYVQASDGGGNTSAPSSTITVTTLNAIPAAPSSLSATADSSTQITLRWTSNSTNESGFKIDRQIGSGNWTTPYSQVAAGATQFHDSSLTASTSYSYRVRAYNSLGDSANTNIASASTLADPPGAPANLTATMVSSTHVNLSWTASTGNAAQYRIERSQGGQGNTYTQVGTSTTPSYSDSTAVTGITYLYRVRAADAGGILSGYSNVDFATTIVFTDEPLCSPSDQPSCSPWTPIKAQHILDLRQAVNAVRLTAGLGAATWTDANLVGVVVKAVHLQELRTNLSSALIALGFSAPSFTDPTITPGQTVIKKVHIEELRKYAK